MSSGPAGVGLTQAFADGGENSWGLRSLSADALGCHRWGGCYGHPVGGACGCSASHSTQAGRAVEGPHPNLRSAGAEGARSSGALLVAAAALFLVALRLHCCLTPAPFTHAPGRTAPVITQAWSRSSPKMPGRGFCLFRGIMSSQPERQTLSKSEGITSPPSVPRTQCLQPGKWLLCPRSCPQGLGPPQAPPSSSRPSPSISSRSWPRPLPGPRPPPGGGLCSYWSKSPAGGSSVRARHAFSGIPASCTSRPGAPVVIEGLRQPSMGCRPVLPPCLCAPHNSPVSGPLRFRICFLSRDL